MNTARKLFAAAAVAASLLAMPLPAHAGSVGNTKITALYAIGTQSVLITFGSNVLPKAACSVPLNQMIVDISTSKGRAILTLANSAIVAELNVIALGTGTCTTPTGGVAVENLTMLGISPNPL